MTLIKAISIGGGKSLMEVHKGKIRDEVIS